MPPGPLVLALTLAAALSPGSYATAQTFVFADDFEAARPTDGPGHQMTRPTFEYALPGWSFPDYMPPSICSCTDRKTVASEPGRRCANHTVEPHSGCTQVLLGYMSRCVAGGKLGAANDGTLEDVYWGCSPYLTRTLDEPLRMGQVYRLSAWVHLLRDRHDDPAVVDSIARQIGVQFFAETTKPNPAFTLYRGAQLRLDTVRYGEWYRVSWTFKPLCELRYLALGVFRNRRGPPIKGDKRGSGLQYFVDDVELVEVPTDLEGLVAATGVCRFEDEEGAAVYQPTDSARAKVYFATGSAELGDSARAALDAFASRAIADPAATYLIYGHADPRVLNGRDLDAPTDNLALSRARIDSTLAHLLRRHRIAPFRFVRAGFGDSRSLGGAEARDRRVEIEPAEPADPSVVPYRYALEEIRAGRVKRAVPALRMWSRYTDADDIALAGLDPRLAPVRELAAWRSIAEPLARRRRALGKPRLARTLDSLGLEDQRYRTLAPRLENLAYHLAEVDAGDEWWDVDFPHDSLTFVAHDARNLARLRALLAEHGWPLVSDVGAGGVHAAALVLIHGGDTAAMARYLPAFEEASRRGEGNWGDFALLTDRYLVASGRPQRYGTQYYSEGPNEEPIPYPIEDEAGLAHRRATIGLD